MQLVHFSKFLYSNNCKMLIARNKITLTDKFKYKQFHNLYFNKEYFRLKLTHYLCIKFCTWLKALSFTAKLKQLFQVFLKKFLFLFFIFYVYVNKIFFCCFIILPIHGSEITFLNPEARAQNMSYPDIPRYDTRCYLTPLFH